MAKRVIVTESSHTSWVDIFRELKMESGWEPVYWTGSGNYLDFRSMQEYFPGCIIQENYEAVKGIPAAKFKEISFPPVDTVVLKDLAYHETVTLKMMDRMDPQGIFSHSERVRLYHQYVRYWSYVLDQLQPDVFLAPVNPHLCYDYVLYQLCRYRGIKCVVFIETNMINLIYLNGHFEEIPGSLLNAYQSLIGDGTTEVALNESNQNYLEKVGAANYNDAIPSYMLEQYEREKDLEREQTFINRAKKKLRARASFIKHTYLTGADLQPAMVYYKIANTPIDQWPLKKQLRRYWLQMEKQTNLLKAQYESLVSEVDYEKPYIFVAFMYQPERTSSPEGGIFNNQYLMIEWLASALPRDWYIYVKEHPSQFIYKVDNTREPSLYNDIVKLPNVKLISTKTDTFRLIDNSKAVATLTGSAGIEGVIRGKPLFCFGNAWYRGCEGVMWIRTLEDLRQAVTLVTQGYTPDKLKVRKYFKALEIIGFKAYVDPYYAASVEYKENVTNLKKAIVDFVEGKNA